MERIIISDETWVYEYNMETSQQFLEWQLENGPKDKKPRQSRSKIIFRRHEAFALKNPL